MFYTSSAQAHPTANRREAADCRRLERLIGLNLLTVGEGDRRVGAVCRFNGVDHAVESHHAFFYDESASSVAADVGNEWTRLASAASKDRKGKDDEDATHEENSPD